MIRNFLAAEWLMMAITLSAFLGVVVCVMEPPYGWRIGAFFASITACITGIGYLAYRAIRQFADD